MSAVLLRASAHCLAGCGWTVEGAPADVERAAGRHFTDAENPGGKPGHSVAITAAPVDPVPPSARQRAIHDVTVDYADDGHRWSCRCGQYGTGFESRPDARRAGRNHADVMRR